MILSSAGVFRFFTKFLAKKLLLNYIKNELRSCDQKLNVSIPNPFAGTHSMEQINADPEKLKALTIIVQFAHHYAKHLMY